SVPGLFHFQMNVYETIFRAHKREDTEFGSMYYWMKLIRHNKSIFDFHTRSIKEFSACDSFLNLIIDAHILTTIGSELEISDWDELCKKLEKSNWRKLIDRIIKKYE